MDTLLAVPNVSEGRDSSVIESVAGALRSHARLLDVHSDPDHHRSVFTLAAPPGQLAEAVLRGAQQALTSIDVTAHQGVHPRIGAIDVAPVVYLDPRARGAACAEALVLADLLGAELGLPVFLYGALAGGRTRAQLRRGGPGELRRRIAAGELAPDFGPRALHPTGGAVLVGARAPLIAFNVELAAPATLEDATAIAASIREGGPHGLTGLRAIGLWLSRRGVAQVSMNVEDHAATPLAAVVSAISRYGTPAEAELVGLAPRAAFDGFPAEFPVRGLRTIEDALGALA